MPFSMKFVNASSCTASWALQRVNLKTSWHPAACLEPIDTVHLYRVCTNWFSHISRIRRQIRGKLWNQATNELRNGSSKIGRKATITVVFWSVHCGIHRLDERKSSANWAVFNPPISQCSTGRGSETGERSSEVREQLDRWRGPGGATEWSWKASN